jgi:kinesin family protein 1
MVAKATNEGRASLVARKSPSKDVYEPWDMTERESELTLKCVKLDTK